jgi:predicted Zn-dependent protease
VPLPASPLAALIREQIARKDLAAAESGVHDWLEREPRSAEAWELQSLLDLQSDEPSTAPASIDKARALGLESRRVESLRAIWLERSGRAAEAQPALIRIIEHSQNVIPEAYEALARILLGTYQLRRASIVLDRWVADHPDDPRPYLMMTEIDERTDRGEAAAVAHFRKALEKAPSLEPALRGLAEALRSANRHEEALLVYDEVLARLPEDQGARLGRAQSLVALGHHDRAAEDIDAVLSQQPDNSDALRLRGSIDLARGDVEQAGQRINRALELDPFDAEARYLHAQALERQGRREEAQKARDMVTRLRADQAALRVIQRDFNQNPNDELRLQIARWMIDHGQGPQGVRWINTILAHDPKHPAANRQLADYYESTGQGGLANFHRLQSGDVQPSHTKPASTAREGP